MPSFSHASSPLPGDFSLYEQALLGGLELQLTHGARRVIVQKKVGMPSLPLLFAGVEWLFARRLASRVLLILASRLYEPLVTRHLERATLRASGLPFRECVSTRFVSALPLEESESGQLWVTNVDFLARRLRDLETRARLAEQGFGPLDQGDARAVLTHLCGQFDLVLLYDLSVATRRWRFLLQAFRAATLVNFCAILDPEVVNLFDRTVVSTPANTEEAVRTLVTAYLLAHPEQLEQLVAQVRHAFRASYPPVRESQREQGPRQRPASPFPFSLPVLTHHEATPPWKRLGALERLRADGIQPEEKGA